MNQTLNERYNEERTYESAITDDSFRIPDGAFLAEEMSLGALNEIVEAKVGVATTAGDQ